MQSNMKTDQKEEFSTIAIRSHNLCITRSQGSFKDLDVFPFDFTPPFTPRFWPQSTPELHDVTCTPIMMFISGSNPRGG